MGQTGSNMVKKVVKPWTWWNSQGEHLTEQETMAIARTANPFVIKRTGSQYFDEDGDLAHEFYEQVPTQKSGKRGRRRKWKRITNNLTPQGEVDLPVPRLHMDLPIVLCEAPR